MAKLLAAFLLCGLGLVVGAKEFKDSIATVEDYQRALKLNNLRMEVFDSAQNFTIHDLILNNERLPNQQDLKCLAELTLLTQGLRSGKFWAYKFIDAWGFLPSGLLRGNLKSFGNFDECIRINAKAAAGKTVKGKYCLAKFPPLIESGVCFPSACTAGHINSAISKIFKQFMGVNYNYKGVTEKSCQIAEHQPMDNLTIFTIVLLSIFGLIVALATLYDYFLCQDQKTMNRFIKVVSARANSRTLFRLVDPKSNPNIIPCLNGIRCLSLIWVIFGHDYITALASPNINMLDGVLWFQTAFSDLIRHGVFSVDSFFFLSGLMVVVIAMRSMDRQKGKLNVGMMYLHRLLRLTPVLAVGILVHMTLLLRFISGPMKNSRIFDASGACEKTWFWTLLYIQNYATKDICLTHSWYLAVDTQLYFISPILLIGLYKWGKKAAAGIVILMLLLSSCLFSMIIIKKYSLVLDNIENPDSERKIYYATHTHASPYLVGILFGYFLHINRGKSFKLNHLTVWLGWLISLALFFTCIFALYDSERFSNLYLSYLDEAFYVTFSRIAWPLGLCWVVFACMQGYGGLANSFLSSPLWQPLAKLSYSAYIFHMFIQYINAKVHAQIHIFRITK